MEEFIVRFEEIRKLIDAINQLSLELTRNRIHFFEKNTIPTPTWREEQASFTTMISWLYVLYFECSPSIKIFETEYPAYLNESRAENMKRHCNSTIHDLRTFFQHNLPTTNPINRQNQKKVDYCFEWLGKSSQFKFPSQDLIHCDWGRCIRQILDESCSFLKGIEDLLNHVKTEDIVIQNQVIDNWIIRITRSFKPFQFELVLKKVLTNYGIENHDASKITKSNYGHWSKQIETQTDGFDFDREATKIIEAHVLKEIGNFNFPFPLSANDVMDKFEVTPGRNLGKIMEFAKLSFEEEPKSKESLLKVIEGYLVKNPELRG